jgi:ADP-ribosyl-[dinitrogen reductase] hydrolase
MSLNSKIKGGLYGVAVGDALGGTTEFMSSREIQKLYGYLTDIVGGGVWDLTPGEVTDDTMMTLCVAEGILIDPYVPKQAIGEKFLEWYRSDPKDIGNIIRRVLSSYQGNWFEAAFLADLDLGESAGNGSLMRCLPVGLIYPNLSDIEKVSRLQSKMTHYDERCNQACEIYNRIVWRLVHGEKLTETIQKEIMSTEYEDILNEAPDCEPSGFVVHTFRHVLHLLLTSDSFSDVVERAANLGGDSDTIGAIAGGLAGVHYGYEGIPERYSGVILVKDELDALSERIFELRNRLA